MESQLKLGRIFGIEIGLHYSWLIIALLIVLSLATHFRTTNPQWGELGIWAMAIITALLFFASIIIHELAHSVVARSRGLPVDSITLFALGGVAKIEKDASDAKTEFWMSFVGPLTSFALGLFFLLLSLLLGWQPMETPRLPLLAMLVWLGYINITLAIFNMLPGFPMDGGRILRAIIWWVTGNANRSTRIAARIGQTLALAFILFGIFNFFTGAGFSGLWIAFIGWFLLQAAGANYAQVELTERLRGVRVRDIMMHECATVESHTNLQTVIEEYLLHTGQRCFVVVENNLVSGIITPQEIKNVEAAKRPFKLVGDVMRPLEELRTVSPETPLAEALEMMSREDLNQLPVISNGHLEGMISRTQVLQYLQTRIELDM